MKEHKVPGVFYNPRRKNFPMDNPNAAEEQIVWEYNHLKTADIIVFWLASGTLNPIVLYELGIWGNATNKPIIIGIDPKYERKLDVLVQTKLARPDIVVNENFEGFCFQIKVCCLENNFHRSVIKI